MKNIIEPLNYNRVHLWIHSHYGKAQKCQNEKCLGKSKNFAWAKKRDKLYEKNINNFMQMCYSCHALYDTTDETRKLMRNLNKNTHKTHCIKGHEFSEGNTYHFIFNGGKRRACKKCGSERGKMMRKLIPTKSSFKKCLICKIPLKVTSNSQKYCRNCAIDNVKKHNSLIRKRNKRKY